MLALVLVLAAAPADAKTLRWAFQGDVNSLDPYALNETFTHGFLSNVYEGLVMRDKALNLVPGLALEWKSTAPTVWRFKLRPNVTFQDGSPFSADDVVFSFQRVTKDGSDDASLVAAVQEVRKVDALTVDLVLRYPDPILPQEITSWLIMSKAWAEKNGAVDPSSTAKKIENFATRNADGTGPFMVKSREPGVKTVLVPNPHWWGKVEHNLTEVVFTPVASDQTRVAALLAGDLDLIDPVPLQDLDRLSKEKSIKLLQGPELRTIFLGLDQYRDQLLYSNVKGKNPFKDRRVRLAVYQAIDIQAIKTRVMRGASRPSGLMVGPGVNGYDAKIDQRYPYDPAAAKKLLADAGYADGFQVTMDCPNDRYINDERICQAVVAMLARIGIKVDLLAQTKARYFQKILSGDTSFYLLGWLPPSYDAHSTLFNVMDTPAARAPGAPKGQGGYNPGGYSNPKVDALTQQIAQELDPAKRQALISEAFLLHKQDVGEIPLHQQALAWGVRPNVHVELRADDYLDLRHARVE
ncbi:MAG TPA: ABC transporter substrate-binding protein [Candidatus Sulfotelmatobacter sp.]|nr:ABC transporter substrate-binding protein [Candidatus Sulfotelmatobacter sp.]